MAAPCDWPNTLTRRAVPNDEDISSLQTDDAAEGGEVVEETGV